MNVKAITEWVQTMRADLMAHEEFNGEEAEFQNRKGSWEDVLDRLEGLEKLVLTSPTRHHGVVWGIEHPGSSQLGCPYCIETLKQGATL